MSDDDEGLQGELVARFDPQEGFTVGRTVEEGLQYLIDSGYFKGAKTCVVAVSSDTFAGFRAQGSLYEQMALANYLNQAIAQQYFAPEEDEDEED